MRDLDKYKGVIPASFVTTREFLLLPKETQKDVVAFLIAMANNKKSRPTDGLVKATTSFWVSFGSSKNSRVVTNASIRE